MSEAAVRERADQAALGGARQRPRPARALVEDRCLPSAVGVLIAVLAFAPLDKKGDVSFILDKKKVENAPERMRVEAARYIGTDDKGQKFEIIANRAIQRSSDVPIVDISGMFARLDAGAGAADDRRQPGPLQSRYAAGRDRRPGAGRRPRRLPARRPATSRSTSSSASWRARARSRARCGSASSRPASSAPTSASRTVVLDGGARLKIVQGAVR